MIKCILSLFVITIGTLLYLSSNTEKEYPNDIKTMLGYSTYHTNNDVSVETIIEAETPASVSDINSENVLATSYKGFGGIGKHEISFEEDEYIFSLEEIEREEIIEECMGNANHLYVPSPAIEIDPLLSMDEIDILLNKENPNDSYYNSLTEDEKIAYNISLYGISNPDNIELDYGEVLSGNSCIAQAFRIVPGVYSVTNLLSSEIQDMEENIARDEIHTILNNEWVSCMSFGGYQFRDRSDIYSQVDEVFSQISSGSVVDGDSSLLELTPQLQDLLTESIFKNDKEILDIRIQTYLADTVAKSDSCDIEIDYERRIKDIRRNYELAFIDANKDILNTSRRHVADK